MSITAKIIEDSINPNGNRLTTFILRYPRFIHSELLTHRALSRNASSSRAIPVGKMIQQVIEDPAMPVHWGAEQRGMQAGAKLSGIQVKEVEETWLRARDAAVVEARRLVELGLHKSLVNRILEPWQYITVVASGTEWWNFFALRCHPDAQAEIQDLAYKMLRLYNTNQPRKLEWGGWHLPFILEEERANAHPEDVLKLVEYSTARCARVSYLNHDGSKPDQTKDIELHDRLVVQTPLHASPAEHPAQADEVDFVANYRGFQQYRKRLQQENVREPLQELLEIR